MTGCGVWAGRSAAAQTDRRAQTRSCDMADVIAKLDAELMAVAVAAEKPSTLQRAGYFTGGLLGGWMFGGAIAGPAGLMYGAAMGAVAGGYRAYFGRPMSDFFQSDFAPPGGGSKLMQSPLYPGAAMTMSNKAPTACASSSNGKPPC